MSARVRANGGGITGRGMPRDDGGGSGGHSYLRRQQRVNLAPRLRQHWVESWDANIPALQRALAKGGSDAQALKAVGLPTITAREVTDRTGSPGRVTPNGPSCRD